MQRTVRPRPGTLVSERSSKKTTEYSDLLDELAKTPAERQQLLRVYWEPNDREREEEKKTA